MIRANQVDVNIALNAVLIEILFFLWAEKGRDQFMQTLV
jgi:hypothetical protein